MNQETKEQIKEELLTNHTLAFRNGYEACKEHVLKLIDEFKKDTFALDKELLNELKARINGLMELRKDKEFNLSERRLILEALQILMGFVSTKASKELYDKFEEELKSKIEED